MEQINYWIIVPFVIFFFLVSIPVAYIWLSPYLPKCACCSSKQLAATELTEGDVEANVNEEKPQQQHIPDSA